MSVDADDFVTIAPRAAEMSVTNVPPNSMKHTIEKLIRQTRPHGVIYLLNIEMSIY